MRKVILVVIAGLLLCGDFYAQQKAFGYKKTDDGDVLSNAFLVANGMKLDSMINFVFGKVYRFEYYPDGRIKSDYNYVTYVVRSSTGQTLRIPAYRQYTYNAKGDIDSIAYFYWYNNKLVNQPGDKLRYEYDTNGKIFKRTTFNDGKLTATRDYSYDSFGNLIQIKRIALNPDPHYDIWKYDSQNRLILKYTFDDLKYTNWDQYVYKYNLDGTIDCILQQVSKTSVTTISTSDKFNLQFDNEGKLINETIYYNFISKDSTWKNSMQFPAVYDSKGRMVEFGNYKEILFHYNSNGNIDTLLFKRAGNEGYFANWATIVDSYGNKIGLGDNLGLYYFYYSKLTTGINEKNNNIDFSFRLSQNYPNPFNPSTKIKYSIPKSALVQIKVFNLLGQEITTIVNEEKQTGNYEVTFNGNNLSSGIYFYQMRAGDYFQTKKLILLK